MIELDMLFRTVAGKNLPRTIGTAVGQEQKRQKDVKGKGVRYFYKKREVNQTGRVNYLHQRNKAAFPSVSFLCLLCLF